MEFDEEKIEAKRVSLGEEWVTADGLHAITTAEYKGKDKLNFNPAQGILIKAFLSNQTGEIKLFPAVIFKKDGV